MRGRTNKTITPKTRIEEERRIQNSAPTSPSVIPTTMANTSNASVSVITVPPTVMFTAMFFATPILLTRG